MASGGGRKPKKTGHLTPKNDLAALALAQGQTRAEAADAAGIGETTLYAWLKDAAFRSLIDQHRKRMVDEAFGSLAKLAAPAFKELDKLLKNRDPKIRLAAVRTAGALLVRVGSYHSLVGRIEDIEGGLREKGQA
jgi:transposase-like protein